MQLGKACSSVKCKKCKYLHERGVLRLKRKQVNLGNVSISMVPPKQKIACTQYYVQKDMEYMLGVNADVIKFGTH